MVNFMEIWCMNNHGIPLYYYKTKTTSKSSQQNLDNEDDGDALLISGLFSAIQAMGDATLNDDLKMIEFGKSKLIFNRKPEITVVGRISSRQKTSVAKNVLKVMTNKFVSDYKDILNDWLGNTIIFNDFEKVVKEYCFLVKLKTDN